MLERGDKTTDARMRRYYDEMRATGMPFNATSMASYAPLHAPALAETLYEFKMKSKSSPMMQLADLCLYPVCRARYEANHFPDQRLKESGRLIDQHLASEDVATCGIKPATASS